jgi:hypothetical protein
MVHEKIVILFQNIEANNPNICMSISSNSIKMGKWYNRWYKIYKKVIKKYIIIRSSKKILINNKRLLIK